MIQILDVYIISREMLRLQSSCLFNVNFVCRESKWELKQHLVAFTVLNFKVLTGALNSTVHLIFTCS